MDGNYIKINRSILDWEWYSDINTHRLFTHMLLKANWKDGKFKGMIVPRGSFISSYQTLAEETGLTVDEIRTALKHLKLTNEITVKSHSKYSVFTVNNYCLYQDIPTQIPVSSQSIPILFPTIEEGKKERIKNKPLTPCSRFEDFLSAYPKKGNRSKTEMAYCKVLLDDSHLTESDLIIAVENYKESISILGTEERYIKNPDRFLTDNTFVDYLDCNYKKPSAAKATGAKQNQFNQFPQRNYDFDELEKKLLSK